MRRVLASLALLLLASPPLTRAQQAPGGEALADAAVKTMLTNMGYNVNETKKKDGTSSFDVDMSITDYTVHPIVELSPSKRYIWIEIPLFEVPANAPGFDPSALLVQNDSIGPYFFSLNSSSRKLYLNYPVLNSGVTPAIVKSAMDGAVSVLNNTSALWDPSKWKGAAPPKK